MVEDTLQMSVQVTRGVAVLGYVPMGNRGLVLLATRTKTVVTLPGGHQVKLVVGSKWVDFYLEVTPRTKVGAVHMLSSFVTLPHD